MKRPENAAGLTSSEAAARLANDGYNELASARPRTVWQLCWDVLREPMLLLLIAAALIYLALGDLGEALVLVASVVVVIGIELMQKRKTERALDVLRELASPPAQVLRDGVWHNAAARELVNGDVILVKEGDRVPADAVLVESTHISADESLLTGESIPVRKIAAAAALSWQRPGGDDLPFLYAGSLITRGRGIAHVTATGARSEIGRIGRSLATLVQEPTPMERDTRRAVVIFTVFGLSFCAVVTVLFALTRGSWLQGLLAGITLAMANLPEEMPVVLTLFLTLGAWRISRHGILTRRSAAIEALGSATVLCVDKTGTLTQNRMEVEALWTRNASWRRAQDAGIALPVQLLEVVRTGALACEREPFDPMEKAFLACAEEHWSKFAARHADWSVVHVYPLLPEQLSVGYVWRAPDEEELFVAAKGAPEAIARLCGLDGGTRLAMEEAVSQLARDGLRVLAVARGNIPLLADRDPPWPNSQKQLRLNFIGVAALADPVRPGVPEAIRECRAAGVRVVMITGDHAATAQGVARQIGVERPELVLTGRELEALSMAQLSARVAAVNVYARVVPDHKLKLIEAFKAAGELVAMTGDGVNDAPALKAAHIGVAMGRRGSDVAREAADLVLLQDDFRPIVAAIRLGRRIFDNIQSAMTYIVAVHVPTAGIALLPLLMGWPLVLYPVHVVFLEFIIDPACSIAFEAEPEEPNIMHRPPRLRAARLFDTAMLTSGILQGICILAGVAAIYGMVLSTGASEGQARAVAFTGIVFGNVALILANRSRYATLRSMLGTYNPALWMVGAGALLALAATLMIEPVRALFRFDAIGIALFALGAAAALPGLAALAALKLYTARRPRSTVGARDERQPARRRE